MLMVQAHPSQAQCTITLLVNITRTRTNTNPNGTKANAVGRRSGNAQTKQVRNDSGGRGALVKFLEKIAKSEEFVGVAHSAEQ